MKIHPLLDNERSVLVSRTPVAEPVSWADYRRAAEQAMAAMQIELEGEKAVLKPNVTSGEHRPFPDNGITTHPAFVEGMIAYLHGHGVKCGGCYVLEDPRNSDDNEPRHWRGTGYPDVAQVTGAKLRTTKTTTCVKKAVPQPQAFPVLNVSRLATSPNTVVFNVPKLKAHNLGITTLCMKNLMGTVNVFDRHFCSQAWREMPAEIQSDPRPREEWFDRAMHEQLQEGLARRLADTAQVVPSHVNVVEGVVGREATGFQRGRSHALGLVVVGLNLVAVDSVASYLVGFAPSRLVYLRVAAQVGLGTNALEEIDVYEVRDGEVVPCTDLAALRFDPPFRVISNIKGEPEWEDLCEE